MLGNERLTTFPVWELNFGTLPDVMAGIATRKVKWDRKYQRKHGIDTGPARDLPPGTDAAASRSSRGASIARCSLSGYARIDLRLKPDGSVFVLEANANPNLAQTEDFATSALAAGLGYDALLERILQARHRIRGRVAAGVGAPIARHAGLPLGWPGRSCHGCLTMRLDGRVRSAAWAMLAALGACCLATPAQAVVAGAPAGNALEAGAPAEAAGDTPANDAGAPAQFKVANRRIATMRVDVLGMSPEERAAAAGFRLGQILKTGGPLEVTTSGSPEGTIILVDGKPVFRVLNGDVDAEAGQTVPMAAAEAVDNLRKALDEIREAEDARALTKAVGYTLLATTLFAVLAWLLLRTYRWLALHAHAMVQRRMGHLLPAWTGEVMGEAAVAGLFTLPIKLLATLLAVLLSYQWAAFVLQRFPYTRPLGESLRDNLLASLGHFGASILDAVPGLLFVALIFLLARIAVRAVRAFFNGVERGHISVAALDETTARPTGKLVTTGIWLLAMVAAYPYIPGSGSEAFKGIGVFVGLMMSIGASGIVSQVVSGLMLMYTRALRPGEFVQIGETEGTVKSVGFVATRIETLRHEEINIPNSVIATTVTRNYSRLTADGGLWIPTKVTIGYDTPWRQVHAMLAMAAERTDGVAKEPAPRVLQTALMDFYVEYTLLVSIAAPTRRLATLDRLHANIQDAFNEFGVQIMSPNYEAIPEHAEGGAAGEVVRAAGRALTQRSVRDPAARISPWCSVRCCRFWRDSS